MGVELDSELADGTAAALSAIPQLPYSFARNNHVLIERASEDDGTPVLVYPKGSLRPEIYAELRRLVGGPVQLSAIDERDFQQRLTAHYQHGDGDAARAAADLDADEDLGRLADEVPDTADLMEGDNDAPVVRLINAILSQAVREQASDIHLETFEDNVTVRFRIDGVLREVLSPKRKLAPMLVSRLKVMARLDIAERRVPQDGRISVRVAGHPVDIRLSTIPSAYGERVVLRLLDIKAGRLSITQLRMGESVDSSFRNTLRAPHGIILVTGPTGSGKTTTLYAGLSEINESSRNIMTIEDPVEYMLKGIAQTQVNTKVKMTFARGLRAILRQDPDVVMIGEIRDIETAEIAIQASMTGHLVLSTLHTNTAIGAVTRLQDMGVETFLLSASLTAVIAQRLVRLLCAECRSQRSLLDDESELLFGVQRAGKSPLVYQAVGCPACNQLGYRGRTALYECIELDDQLRQMIRGSVGEQEMTAYAREHSESMFDDGRRRVLAGETTLEEVLRVTRASG